MGYGTAIQTLFEKARALNGDLLLIVDADGQHDAEEIPKLIQPILENRADVVMRARIGFHSLYVDWNFLYIHSINPLRDSESYKKTAHIN